jgi:hypothetical protein
MVDMGDNRKIADVGDGNFAHAGADNIGAAERQALMSAAKRHSRTSRAATIRRRLGGT